MSPARTAFTVYGMVQGVGFRYYTYRKALELQLSGFVRNNPDGSVYVEVEGETNLIDALKRLLQIGPPSAQVDEIITKPLPLSGIFHTFEIKH